MTAMKNLMRGSNYLDSSGKSFLSKFILRHDLSTVPSCEDLSTRTFSWRHFKFLHICSSRCQVPADRCALDVGTPLSAGRRHPGR